ncbi:hypothetical protein KC19_3G239800 [Ceratodon purpureus]|uniref:Uncharacterized protein n=1 Tax=Ceratodon purpureus TaxID=3225 RepID=A0A8T0IPV2_CERPU|nr:hypothetical protein KC19_3G239800 [Ceratodon purpureus]
MSFMSVPALDRLLEPAEGDGSSWRGRGDRRAVMNMSPVFPSSQSNAQASPPPAPFSPSPYVLNFKRRVFDGNGAGESVVAAASSGGQAREATASFRESEVVSELRNKVIGSKNGVSEDGVLPVGEKVESFGGKASREGLERLRGKNGEKMEKVVTDAVVKVEEGIFNGRRWQRSRSRNSSVGQQDIDSVSVASSNREEFFDAPEEPLDDASSDDESLRGQRTPRSIAGGRRDVDAYLKLQLDQEIKRRMAAEDAMAVLQLQCTEMASQLASLDDESHGLDDSDRNERDSGSQAQKLVVAQVVAYSVARGAARAEVHEEMENVVAEKNREIARLRDKLHYYELVNHEMSQRNQEAFELARSRRHIRRNRNQWLMVCAGSVICVGVSAILVSKFAPWATSHFPSKSILPSQLRTDVQHSSSSHDI